MSFNSPGKRRHVEQCKRKSIQHPSCLLRPTLEIRTTARDHELSFKPLRIFLQYNMQVQGLHVQKK